MDSERSLDDVDWRLLEEIQQNSRVSFSEIGRRIGLTQPAVAERVHRMEEAGIIVGYCAELNLRLVGLPVLAFIRVCTHEASGACLEELARTAPRVLECHRIIGDDSYLLKVVAASVHELEEIISRIKPCGQTTTSLVLSSPVVNRVLVPAERQG